MTPPVLPFRSMHAMQGKQTYQLRASYLELYDEQITDLLAVGNTGQLTIREDVCNETARVYVEGLTEVELLNGEHTLHLKLLRHHRYGHGAWAKDCLYEKASSAKMPRSDTLGTFHELYLL
jgi:hypothetical protein